MANSKTEKAFGKAIEKLLKEHGGHIVTRGAVASAAYLAQCTIKNGWKYLEKLTSEAGPLIHYVIYTEIRGQVERTVHALP